MPAVAPKPYRHGAPRWKYHSQHRGKSIWLKYTRHGKVYTWTDSYAQYPERYAKVASDLRSVRSNIINGVGVLHDHPSDYTDPNADYAIPVRSRRLILDKSGKHGLYFNRKLRQWVPIVVARTKETNTYEHLTVVEVSPSAINGKPLCPPQRRKTSTPRNS